jgi:hypothetical protein
MFMVWRGFGFLVPMVFAVAFLSAWGLMGYLFGLAGLTNTTFQYAILTASLLAAAVANWFIGRWFNRVPPRELIDPNTGQTVLMKSKNDLFFIPMEYWSIPVAMLALLSTTLFFG